MALNAAEIVVLKDGLNFLQDGLSALAPLESASPIISAILTFLNIAITYSESLIPAAPAAPAAPASSAAQA